MAYTLATTDTELHGIDTALDNVRASSSTVKVDKEALRHLLADHFTLQQEARRRGNPPAAGPDQASLL